MHNINIHMLDGFNYSTCKEFIRGYMVPMGNPTWEHVGMKYVFPQNGLSTQDEITIYEENEK